MKATRPRSAPLAEKKAEVRELEAAVRRHRMDCILCAPREKCPTRSELDEDLASVRQAVRDWFKPGPADPQLDLGLEP